MTTGNDFLQAYVKSSQPTWESAAVRLAEMGDVVQWPMVDVLLTLPSAGSGAAHTGSVRVSSDVFAVGVPEDFLRLPLAPIAAQRVANLGGYLLPTRKIAGDIWRAAAGANGANGARLTPAPATAFGQVNKGPNLAQYADHNAYLQKQLAALGKEGTGTLVTGHKKDVVIGAAMKPGRVVIYGWFNPDGSRIQPLTNVHDDAYADYSHGIRFVAPVMTVDGHDARLEDVLKDKELSALVSDEGALTEKQIRYPTPGSGPGSTPAGGGGGGALASAWNATIYRRGWSDVLGQPRKYA